MTQRTTPETLAWYRENGSNPPINPDGMCLSMCRRARNIPPKYPSALSAQEATPEEYRFYNLDEVKRGMVMYFDDPADSNPYGHIVTVAGRVKGTTDRNDPSKILVWTNSVVRGELVVVRANYFWKYWGDQFQFAATWLNGEEIDDLQPPEPRPPRQFPTVKSTIENITDAINELNSAIIYHESRKHPRIVMALKRDRNHLRQVRRGLKATTEEFK
jgi:hypothetical protein